MSDVLKRILQVFCVALSFVSIAVIAILPFATAKPVWMGIGITFLVLTCLIWITYFILRVLDQKYKYSETNKNYKTALEVFANLSLWFIYGFKQIYYWICQLIEWFKKNRQQQK